MVLNMKSLRNILGNTKVAAVFGVAALGASAMAQTQLYVTGMNNGESITGHISYTGGSGSINSDAYIGSLYGNYTIGATSYGLGEFFCVDLLDSISLPTNYAVTGPTAVSTGTLGEAAWLITTYSAGFGGTTVGTNYSLNLNGNTYTKNEVDAALQLAIWKVVFPTETYTAGGGKSDANIGGLATWMVGQGTGHTATGYELANINGDGQSMLFVPGGGNHTPGATPEPVTIALGIAGLGMAIRRRFVK